MGTSRPQTSYSAESLVDSFHAFCKREVLEPSRWPQNDCLLFNGNRLRLEAASAGLVEAAKSRDGEWSEVTDSDDPAWATKGIPFMQESGVLKSNCQLLCCVSARRSSYIQEGTCL